MEIEDLANKFVDLPGFHLDKSFLRFLPSLQAYLVATEKPSSAHMATLSMTHILLSLFKYCGGKFSPADMASTLEKLSPAFHAPWWRRSDSYDANLARAILQGTVFSFHAQRASYHRVCSPC
jgi:hypothetical protein